MIMGHMYIHIEDCHCIFISTHPKYCYCQAKSPIPKPQNPGSGLQRQRGATATTINLKTVLMIGQLDLLFAFKGHVS